MKQCRRAASRTSGAAILRNHFLRTTALLQFYEHSAILLAAIEPVAPDVEAVQPIGMIVLRMAAAAKGIERAITAHIAVHFVHPTPQHR